MATETDIVAALFGRVNSLVLTPALAASAVSWPNVTFTPPSTQRYLEVKFVPNANTRFGHSRTHRIFGLLQLNMHGKKGVGETACRTDAAALAAHFPADLALDSGATRVRIYEPPAVRDLIVADASIIIPVIVA